MTRAIAALVAVLALAGCGGGRVVRAEFTSARGLVEGNDVRLHGAVAGTVRRIELTRRGTARVTLALRAGVPGPRSDAAATVRPADLLGDTYVAYEPGTSRTPLRGAMGVARTAAAARLDDLLQTFDPGVRAGLRALLVESGIALDDRGADLGRLTVALRPALDAADGTLRRLAAEEGALRALIGDAERAATPLAARGRDLAGLVDRLDRVLAETGRRGGALGAGLEGMPATLRAVRSTAGRLATTVTAARPLAAQLRDVAPALGRVISGAPALIGEARSTIRSASPALATLRSTLVAGAPALRSLAAGSAALAGVAPETAQLASEIAPASAGISQGFFENFADQAAESGRQPFDPFADPTRAYWRGAAVLSCETFGVPVAPGCLDRVLPAPAPAPSPSRKRRPPVALPKPAPKPVLPLPVPVPTVPPQLTDLLDSLLKP
jgi:phospholipid/cholesterol/gamma-HCH transport system substrate-binding protein